MNSVTTLLDLGDRRVVAKWVPTSGRADLIRGAEAALLMSERGIRSGRPITTACGRLTVSWNDGELVLLAEVAGEPLGLSRDELGAVGTTLALVHSITARKHRGEFFGWLYTHGSDSSLERWIRRVVERVWREQDALPELIWATLHTDPAPGALLRDANGDIGLIDWTGTTFGPVLYDLASACMYAESDAGAEIVLGAYRSTGLVRDDEIDRYLPAFHRFRATVQAVYFTERIRDDDLPGIDGPHENTKGLDDAKLLLARAGIDVDEFL